MLLLLLLLLLNYHLLFNARHRSRKKYNVYLAPARCFCSLRQTAKTFPCLDKPLRHLHGLAFEEVRQGLEEDILASLLPSREVKGQRLSCMAGARRVMRASPHTTDKFLRGKANAQA